MCGIWGYIDTRAAGTGDKEARILRDLCVAGTMRGWDGTGIFYQDAGKKAEVFYHKLAVTGAGLMNKYAWEDTAGGNRFVVGHNRAATIGALDEAHTHPFAHENVIGVHNGTIHSWRLLFPDTNALLDSDAVFEALSEADDANDVLPKLSAGAYALVWFDHRDGCVHLARNDERPMTFVRTVNGTFFASELKMLEWCIDRHGLRMLESWALAEHTHLTLPLDGSEASVQAYKPKYGYGSVTYGDSWDSYAVTYGNATTWQNTKDYWAAHDDGIPTNKVLNVDVRAPKKDTSMLMRSYAPVELGTLPFGVERRIVKKIRDTLGAPVGSASLYSDLQAFAVAAQHAAELTVDDYAGPRAPMYVVGMDGRTAYGYIEVEGHKQAAVVRVYHRGILEQLKALLDNNLIARLESPVLDAVRVFSTGTLTFELDDIVADTYCQVWATDISLKDTIGGQLEWDFHMTSDYALEQDDDIDTNWSKGWEEKVA